MGNKLTTAAWAVSTGLLAAAAVWAAPAQADPIDDSFLSALNGAGINLGNTADPVGLGQSVCPMLADSASTMAPAASNVTNAVSSVTGQSGMSPEMAGLFTRLAVTMYCPEVLASLSDGQLPQLPKLPGLSGLPGLSLLPGLTSI